MEGWLTVRNVTQPALYPVVPDKGKANGTSVIIAPGGADHWIDDYYNWLVGEHLTTTAKQPP
jgi:hypothetical protein